MVGLEVSCRERGWKGEEGSGREKMDMAGRGNEWKGKGVGE